MRYLCIILIFIVFAQASFAVLIDGYCYYEDGSDYSGSTVKFLAVTPSAETDSTETLPSGYFSIDVVPGIYDVVYSRDGFLPVQIDYLILLADTTMPPVTLYFGRPLSGALNGTLGPGGFIVFDNISVEFGDTLRLVPGTAFRFAGLYSFEIEGTLLAQGTLQDSILFTTMRLLNPDYWENIRFNGVGSSGCSLAYCDIQYGNHPNLGGGAIQCIGASPTITNSTFRDNTARLGGGIGIEWDSSPTITHCTFFGNTAELGGAIYCGDGASPTIAHCIIRDNSADFGGGIYCGENSSPTITRCTIVGDSASFGGGVSCRHASLVMNSTIIAFTEGSGLYFQQDCSGSLIEYCDIFGNIGGEISFYNQDPSQGPPDVGNISTTNANGDSCDSYFNIFLNPALADTAERDYRLALGSPCIDAGDSDLPLDPDTTVADIGAFYFQAHPPLPFNLLSPENGETVDTLDVTLIWAASSDPDPGDSIVFYRIYIALDSSFSFGLDSQDVSATEIIWEGLVDGQTYWWRVKAFDTQDSATFSNQVWSFTSVASAISGEDILLPAKFALAQNYPNPFNPTTTIQYDVKQTTDVSVKIFNLLGREVATLIHERVPAGSHTVSWDATDLPSGIYFCQMAAGDFMQSMKMVLLK